MLGKAVLKELIKDDLIWAVGAALFLLCYLALHMKSFALAVYTILLIVFSFSLTQTIYYFILGIHYYQALHLMTVFLVLGIAADDIFVFHDAWMQAASKYSHESIDKRMSYTLRRAYRQMLSTSSTTSVAFISNYFSSLLPVATFGIYAAIIIMINFLFAITLFPAAEMALYNWRTRNQAS